MWVLTVPPDLEPAADQLVRQSFTQQPEHFELTRGQMLALCGVDLCVHRKRPKRIRFCENDSFYRILTATGFVI